MPRSDEWPTATCRTRSAALPRVRGPAPEKCVFIYNSSKNVLARQLVRGLPDRHPLHRRARSATRSRGNAFIGNRTQVKYVGTALSSGPTKGRGNYWSDNPAFDLNGDGIADQPYRPNDMMDRVMWTYPRPSC